MNSTSATETKQTQMPEAIIESPSTANTTTLEVAVKLLRHLSPSEAENNLNLLVEGLPELEADLRSTVSVPSKIIVANNREFLANPTSNGSSSNSFRCPWDNEFYTETGESITTDPTTYKEKTEEKKQLELALNEAVSAYVSLYYGTEAISSVFVEEFEETFTVQVLIKKCTEMADESEDLSAKAVWDSAHLFKVKRDSEGSDDFVYNHSTTIMLSFDSSTENLKNIKLSGNMVYKNEVKAGSQHLIHIGTLLEESESRLRNDLQSVYFGRTHDIVNELRNAMPEGFLRNQNDLRDEMLAKLSARN